MFCFHKYNKIESDGYQYCEKCGKARKVECNHSWKIIECFKACGSTEYTFSAKTYVLQCTKCGIIKSKEVT
jgi:hypothetical protein